MLNCGVVGGGGANIKAHDIQIVDSLPRTLMLEIKVLIHCNKVTRSIWMEGSEF